MNKILFLICFILFSISANAHILKGKVIRISDGDTVVVLDESNIQHRIRLDGIDAPEKGQPFGKKATDFVKELIAGKIVTVHWQKKDRYGRILGYVLIGEINVNKELLKNGLAWHYKFFNSDQELAKLERNARKLKLNIWSDKNPIEPYIWRNNKRKKGS